MRSRSPSWISRVCPTSARIGAGGAAYAFARSPYAHAAAMRDLAAQAPGRLFLGLGSGAYRINRDWFGVDADRPVARLAELADAVRAWLHAENGDRVRFSGEFYSIDADVRAPVLGRLDIPVLLAAFNKAMAATAGRVADGVIGHGLFTRTWWDDVVRPATDKGFAERQTAGSQLERPAERQTERQAEHPTERAVEHGWVITAIDDAAPERAIADARRMIAFYLTVKTYDPYVAHHGWEAPVQRLRTAFRNGDTDRMADAVTDEMLTAIAVCGTTGEAAATLRRRSGSLPRDVAYFTPPSFLVSRRRRAGYGRAFLGVVHSVPATG